MEKEPKINQEFIDGLIKRRAFKWVVGAAAWPSKQMGLCVAVGSYFGGRERPMLCLIAEAESGDTKELCRNVLEFDHRFAPEFWYGDKTNDAALKILHQLNEEVRTVLAGVQYAVANAPWHRRYISIGQSPVFEMSNGPDYVLSVLNDLLPEEEQRLFLPKNSKCLEQLRSVDQLVERLEGLTWETVPALAALGVACVELEILADNERRQKQRSVKRQPDKSRFYNRVKRGF